MDRARRAEPYSNATIWTREIARNLAGHLARISKAHSCVDTTSPKSTHLPQFYHKRCSTSPVKTRHAASAVADIKEEQPEDTTDIVSGGSARLELPSATVHTSRASSEATHHQNVKVMRRKVKSLPKHLKVELDKQEPAVGENQRLPHRLDKPFMHVDPTSNNHITHAHDVSAYDSASPIVLNQRMGHDYIKRQEQRKIWEENQALSKRLRNTKATLPSKEWERDDKRNQQFLKTNEKRRITLQQELLKAQMSPQATAVRVKRVHNHSNNLAVDSPLESSCRSSLAAEVTVKQSAQLRHRRQSKEGTVAIPNEKNAQATAANHRRIMLLRKQKSSSRIDDKSTSTQEETHGHENTDGDCLGYASVDKTADGLFHETELTHIRFTFSRQKNRSETEMNSGSGLSQSPRINTPRENQTDMMSLSGAFSPGLELETALDEINNEATGLGPREPECFEECTVAEQTPYDDVNDVDTGIMNDQTGSVLVLPCCPGDQSSSEDIEANATFTSADDVPQTCVDSDGDYQAIETNSTHEQPPHVQELDGQMSNASQTKSLSEDEQCIRAEDALNEGSHSEGDDYEIQHDVANQCNSSTIQDSIEETDSHSVVASSAIEEPERFLSSQEDNVVLIPGYGNNRLHEHEGNLQTGLQKEQNNVLLPALVISDGSAEQEEEEAGYDVEDFDDDGGHQLESSTDNAEDNATSNAKVFDEPAENSGYGSEFDDEDAEVGVSTSIAMTSGNNLSVVQPGSDPTGYEDDDMYEDDDE